jgi:aryl-alcohol dehydrogenase-like predicted oxidoreductase
VRLDLSRLDDITGQVKRSTEESLSRLRCDSVELLQLHNPIGPQTVDQLIGVDQVLGEDGVADALERMRELGLTRHIGITAIGDTAACRRVIASDRFDSAQVYYNILNPSAGQDMPPAWQGRDFRGLITACKEHGVAVMNIRVLAAGVLATEQRHGREVQMMSEAAIPIEEIRARAVWRVLDERYGTRARPRSASRWPIPTSPASWWVWPSSATWRRRCWRPRWARCRTRRSRSCAPCTSGVLRTPDPLAYRPLEAERGQA